MCIEFEVVGWNFKLNPGKIDTGSAAILKLEPEYRFDYLMELLENGLLVGRISRTILRFELS